MPERTTSINTDSVKQRLLEYALANGTVSSVAFAEQTGLSRGIVYKCLRELVDQGSLISANQVIHSPEHYRALCAKREEQRQEILTFVKEHGLACYKQIEKHLGVTWYVARALVEDLIKPGQLSFDGKYLVIPRSDGSFLTNEARLEAQVEQQKQRICDYIEKNGASHFSGIVSMLDIGTIRVRGIIRDMVSSGRLVRVGNSFYLPDQYAKLKKREARRKNKILAYVKQNGSITYSKAEKTFNLPWYEAHNFLRELLEEGKLTYSGRVFVLPPDIKGYQSELGKSPINTDIPQAIMDYVSEHGVITASGAERISGINAKEVYVTLKKMVHEGKLEHIGRAYYSPERAKDVLAAKEEGNQIILDYIKENGSIRCNKAASLLNLSWNSARLRLNDLCGQEKVSVNSGGG